MLLDSQRYITQVVKQVRIDLLETEHVPSLNIRLSYGNSKGQFGGETPQTTNEDHNRTVDGDMLQRDKYNRVFHGPA